MANRDSYCTPRWITKRLPMVDLDPCSNKRSTVRSRKRVIAEEGGNGLLIPWTGLSIFANTPYSNNLPWAIKAWSAAAFCLLVNVAPSTKWWRAATEWESHVFLFRDRIDFVPPPGVETSSNDCDSCFIVNTPMRAMLGDSFRRYGEWWKRR